MGWESEIGIGVFFLGGWELRVLVDMYCVGERGRQTRETKSMGVGRCGSAWRGLREVLELREEVVRNAIVHSRRHFQVPTINMYCGIMVLYNGSPSYWYTLNSSRCLFLDDRLYVWYYCSSAG